MSIIDRILLPIILSTILLSSCAQTTHPYDGLTKLSYGSLSKYKDKENLLIDPPLCEDGVQDPGVRQIAREITGIIFIPLQGMTHIDETIRKQDLQDSFTIPGDFIDEVVHVVEYSNDGIAFWYINDTVILYEVAKAAKKFCGKRNLPYSYEGSSRRCSDPKLAPISINGKSKLIETYVISSFLCTNPLEKNTRK